MTRKTPSTPAEYWQFFLRRKWWLIIPAVSISLSVFAITWRLPRIYKSETMIMIDAQKVPEQYVQSTVNSDIANRLQTISQEILSRTRLQKLIEQFGLYKELKAKKSQEEIIDQMRQDVTVDVVTDPRDGRPSVGGFKIAYAGRDPQLVQQVTRQIASLFIEENLKVREQQAEGTSEFIGSELEKARQSLQSQEEKVQAFKSQHSGSLPEQQGSNLQMLGQLQGLLQTNSDAIGRAQNQKQYLTSMLQTVGKLQPQTQTIKTRVELELETRKSELLTAEQKYSADHPDVIRLRSEVKALEAQSAQEKKLEAATPKVSESPDQIKIQIAALDQEIKNRTDQMTATEQKIRSIQGRVDSLPAVEQQFAALSRDYEVSRITYQQLLAKNNGASMSAEMERRAKGEQFRVVDPASLPEKPFKPNLQQLNSMGLMGGLLVGIGLAFVMELKDHSIHNKEEMAYYLSVPVLATMPLILTEEDRVLAKKLLIKKLAIGTAAGVVAAVLGVVVLRSAFFNSLLGRS